MSISIDSPVKKQECGNPGRGGLPDIFGTPTHLQIVGSDPDVSGAYDGSTIAVGTYYAPDPENTNNGTFMITIETDAATYYVHLEDGTDFIITPAQSTAYLGQWYPAKLLRVDHGTTGKFCVGY